MEALAGLSASDEQIADLFMRDGQVAPRIGVRRRAVRDRLPYGERFLIAGKSFGFPAVELEHLSHAFVNNAQIALRHGIVSRKTGVNRESLLIVFESPLTIADVRKNGMPQQIAELDVRSARPLARFDAGVAFRQLRKYRERLAALLDRLPNC